MAWYNKINPFLKTEEKAPGMDEAMFQPYSLGGQLSNITPSDYVSAYGQVGWVFACVSRIASAVAETNWKLYQIKDNKEREEIINHPILSLFDFVNEYHTGMEMMEQTQTFIDLTGEAFWLIIKDRANRPAELWVINPNKIKVVPHSNDYIAGYVYVNGQTQIPLEKSDIIHIKMPNPSNPYRGQSPIASIMSDIEAEKFSSQYNKSFFQNSAEPAGVIQFEGTLTDSQYERLRYQWNQQHQGVSRSHKVAILEGGASWQEKTISQKDMQFQQLRLMNRDVILGAYGMPMHILGISESVNRANAEAAEYTFARWVLKPRLQRIRAKVNEQFVPMFGEKFYFDFDSPVPEDVARNLSVADQGFKSGYITRNEARHLVGLGEVRNGDVFMMPLASMPENVTRQKELQPVETSIDAKQDYKEYRWKGFVEQYENLQEGFRKEISSTLKEQKEEILKNINRKPDDQVIDEPKWIETFKESIKPFYRKAIIRGGEDTKREIVDMANQRLKRSVKQTLSFDYDFNGQSPEVDDWIESSSLRYAQGINSTTRRAVQATLLAGRSAGKSLDEISEEISGLTQFGIDRARTIARTETLSALNQGHLESAKQSEVVAQKEWLSAIDEATRDTHVIADGQKQPLDQPFIVGYDSMMAPGQGSAPEENINCRCTMTEVLDVDAVEERSTNTIDITRKSAPAGPQSKEEYQYPLQEARCPDCDKLLAKKLLGTVSLYCNRCKKEVKFTE